MNAQRPNELGRAVMRFFQEYLPTLRGMSPCTVQSYRDAMVLFLRFAAKRRGCGTEDLDLEDLCTDTVAEFLHSLETDRHNSIATRNARLAALHTFARFLAYERPDRLGAWQGMLGIPFKRGARKAPIEYLETDEVDSLLKSIERSSDAGQRDYALFALMFNTGARVQELLDLRVSDVRLEPPCQVRLRGKGGKLRLCPIWPHTARLLRPLLDRARTSGQEAPLFVSRRGGKLTRFGVRYLLRKYLQALSPSNPALTNKRIHPHSLRHTTAIHMLKAGVDLATISHWLGHASLNTTMRYARADLDLKRQALLQVFPDVLAPPAPRADPSLTEATIIDWLKRL